MLVTRRGILAVLTDEAVRESVLKAVNKLTDDSTHGQFRIHHLLQLDDCQSELAHRTALETGRDMGQVYVRYDRE
jgi:hypothetical protein